MEIPPLQNPLPSPAARKPSAPSRSPADTLSSAPGTRFRPEEPLFDSPIRLLDWSEIKLAALPPQGEESPAPPTPGSGV